MCRYDREPTALNYGYWSTIPTLIEQVPPLGAVRAKFGSWQTTLHRGRTQIARELRLWTKNEANVAAVKASAAEELELLDAELTNADAELANAELTEAELAELDTPDVSPAGTPAEPAEPARLSARELTEQGIGVVQTAHTDLAAYHRDPVGADGGSLR